MIVLLADLVVLLGGALAVVALGVMYLLRHE